ncbi:MAG: glycosyltransferase family 2 protein [Candidatus Parvarchaeota archaeon]
MTNNKTDLTVIIPVYNRTEYVNEAVESVLNLNKNKKIEILIISNVDLKLDFDNKTIKVIKTTEYSLSRKLELGIKNSSSSLIAFLEDDDLWCNDKLNKLLDAFKNNEEVDFYYNKNIQFRDKIISNTIDKNEKKPIIIKRESLNNSTKAIRLMIKNNMGYNLSSMAIKRDLLLDHLNVLTSSSVYGVDSLVLVIALAYGRDMYLDNSIRTFIRIHRNNSYYYKVDPPGELFMSRDLVNSEIKNKNIEKFIELVRTATSLVLNCRTPKLKRYTLFKDILRYIKYCFELGILPSLYILGSAGSRMVSIKFYYYLLNMYHNNMYQNV